MAGPLNNVQNEGLRVQIKIPMNFSNNSSISFITLKYLIYIILNISMLEDQVNITDQRSFSI